MRSCPVHKHEEQVRKLIWRPHNKREVYAQAPAEQLVREEARQLGRPGRPRHPSILGEAGEKAQEPARSRGVPTSLVRPSSACEQDPSQQC